jgi:glycosyltransferase involved in cell wall biosynthesis
MNNSCVIFYEGYIDVAPTVRALISFLSLKSKLDVYMPKVEKYSLDFVDDNPKVNWFLIDLKKASFCKYIKYLKRFIKFIDIELYADYWSKMIEISYFSKQVNTDISYDNIYIIDSTGLMIFNKTKLRFKKGYYVSLEIIDLLKPNITLFEKKLKSIEFKSLLKNRFKIIIQDKFRFELLFGDKSYLFKENVFFLPNSTESKKMYLDVDYLKNKFKLNKEDKVILIAGMWSSEVLSYEIINEFGKIKNSIYHLVIHDRLENLFLNEYLKDRDRIYFSDTPFNYKKLDILYAACDIGLVFYDTESKDRNFSIIGAASGKLFNYLKNGKPVIVLDNIGLSDLIIDLRCGIVIQNLNQIEAAIDEIFENYLFYSTNALQGYTQNFDMFKILNSFDL